MGLAGDGPFPTSAAAPHDFSVMRTSPIQPAGVKAWKKIGVDADLHGGQLKIKISTDGLTWRPVEELAKLPAHGDGADVLHVRIALRRAPGNPSPKLKRAWVDYDAGGVPELVVKNSALEMRFSPEGHLMGIRDVGNDRWILPHAIHQRLFELKTRSPGENSLRAYQQGEGPTLIDRRYEKTGDRQRLAFTYGLLDSAIRATCTFTLDSTSLATWSMQIVNESPVEVREYTFPQFRGLRLGRSELDDLAAWCTTVGGLYPSPGAGGLDWLTTMRYPGDCGMPWADFSDPSGGFYLCSQDPTLTATDIIYDPGANRGSWNLRFTKQSYVPAGKSARFQYQIGVHPGDWHWAADAYHRWFYSWNQPPKHPEWTVTNPGWWYSSGSQCLYSRMATHWWPRAEWLGFHHYQNWGTTADSESCGFWNHFNPKLGSREELIAANAALKKLDCHFGGYIKIHGWTNDYRRNPEFVGFTPKKFFERASTIFCRRWTGRTAAPTCT